MEKSRVTGICLAGNILDKDNFCWCNSHKQLALYTIALAVSLGQFFPHIPASNTSAPVF